MDTIRMSKAVSLSVSLIGVIAAVSAVAIFISTQQSASISWDWYWENRLNYQAAAAWLFQLGATILLYKGWIFAKGWFNKDQDEADKPEDDQRLWWIGVSVMAGVLLALTSQIQAISFIADMYALLMVLLAAVFASVVALACALGTVLGVSYLLVSAWEGVSLLDELKEKPKRRFKNQLADTDYVTISRDEWEEYEASRKEGKNS